MRFFSYVTLINVQNDLHRSLCTILRFSQDNLLVVWSFPLTSSALEAYSVAEYLCKGKGKVHPRTGQEGLEVELRYSSALSLTSALEGVGVQRHAPSILPPGKALYPMCRRLGGPQNRSGQVRKISPPPGFDPRTVQPVASRYTDWAI